jgi:hypothetical protein
MTGSGPLPTAGTPSPHVVRRHAAYFDKRPRTVDRSDNALTPETRYRPIRSDGSPW